ncbi:ATP-binding cassette domain-containing protein [Natronomonas sp. CBA1123]|uniref:ABC transporter ATP-binding protein n=1 Tax=Natronomonas sp. CBA1123 TaxID=2668070 RepID=UPI0012E9F42D|nr:ABC transporter ATP-binding protein [Natronomonas sp. CBA1123]MUV86234.1 ATP-binding cassette domain-containing protein [Natronomonas sp. CBA1123]
MVLRTTDLTKRFGGVTAVDGVEFELGAECCSLIGPNGAGKTTFFNLLTGVLEPTEGTVEYRGGDGDGWTDITDHAPHETALSGIHRSYQITNIFATSTVLENVRIAAQAAGGADSFRAWRNVEAFPEYEREADHILERVGLADERETVAETLSHGEKRNLELAIALAGDPDVLLLDEPTAGVSSDGIDELTDLIDDIAADHAVLLVEHNMDVVMEVSDRIAVLNQGSLIADDDPEAIRDSQRVQDAYLGGYEPDSAAASDDADDATGGGLA